MREGHVQVEQADVVVLGLGTGGEDLALRLLDEGLDVVGIEPHLVGGECPYWACIPSKMMIRAANLLQEARRVNGMAGHAEIIPDWSIVADRVKTEATGDWDDSYAVARFEGKSGRFVRGHGKLTGPNTVTVGERSFTATRGIVIATGSRPFIPPIPGLSEVDYWTTHDAIQAQTLPKSLVVLGGGAVGCELGQVISRFGVDVTIAEGSDRLLALEEPEASESLAQAFEAEGIAVHKGSHVEKVESRGDLIFATLTDGTELSAERLLVATGRAVDLDGLGLESAGIDTSGRFVPVDEYRRAADDVWAMGDVTGNGMFTHMALYEGAIVADGILDENPSPADFTSLPRVTFTDPEVGSVGMSETAARKAGLNVAVSVKQVPLTSRGWIHGPSAAGVIKLIVDKDNGLLVGATSAGPQGGEVLSMLSLAVQAKVPYQQLRHMIYAYPTFHGGIGEATGAYGRGTMKVIDPDFDPLILE
jgi:pyruvate/2-oxoglutarate dehydrogenase complex dihydrolipoamide dehydrogenase (E3) component